MFHFAVTDDMKDLDTTPLLDILDRRKSMQDALVWAKRALNHINPGTRHRTLHYHANLGTCHRPLHYHANPGTRQTSILFIIFKKNWYHDIILALELISRLEKNIN